MNWYLQSGKESDVVVSSRIRLARNIIEYPFETRCSKKENEEIVDKIKEVLSGREQDIIRKRYGIGGFKIKTQREIAAEYGISRSYISRIEKSALLKLRKSYENDCL